MQTTINILTFKFQKRFKSTKIFGIIFKINQKCEMAEMQKFWP